MPRNPGTGIYEQPSPDVITATTIESTVYNGFVNDVETDLNTPRPIVSGGTGADNATNARVNLKTEVSAQQVTNYDSHVFEAGSFYSNPGATSEPVAGQYASGVCHFVNPSSIVLTAYVYGTLTAPGRTYTREKWATWGPWKLAGSDQFVDVAGDTITGGLVVGGPITCNAVNSSFNLNLFDAATTATVKISCNTGVAAIATRPNNDAGQWHHAFEAFTGNVVGTITTNATTTTYATSSDGGLKEDLKSFDAGNIVDDTNVYDFAWKSTGERDYGVIAQQAVEVYPSAVVHTEANEKDGVSEWWGIDYSKYVPVLLQELKALRARVTELEGRLEIKPP